MDFIDQIKQFSKRVNGLKDGIMTEEATKTSIIMPFFSMLGYDVFNPEEFIPEFTADVGIKKGEKVDYAILNNGNPVILIEAKWVKEDLQKHDSQLFRYFGTTKAKFAILTNGLIYRFYTDLEEPNVMDEKPFLELNILDIKENIVSEIKKFRKDAFNVEEIFDTASELKYSNEIRAIFSQEIQNPSDDFIRFFLNGAYSGMKTQAVIEKFRPIIKKTINQYISEIMNDKIKNALKVEAKEEAKNDNISQEENLEEAEIKEESKIVTTEEELEAYFIIKNILKEEVPAEDITYKDNERYMSILYRGKVTKWLCRLYFTDTKKVIAIPDENKKELKIKLNNLYDIEEQKVALINVLKRYL